VGDEEEYAIPDLVDDPAWWFIHETLWEAEFGE
jgi:hypothetical protein